MKDYRTAIIKILDRLSDKAVKLINRTDIAKAIAKNLLPFRKSVPTV